MRASPAACLVRTDGPWPAATGTASAACGLQLRISWRRKISAGRSPGSVRTCSSKPSNDGTRRDSNLVRGGSQCHLDFISGCPTPISPNAHLVCGSGSTVADGMQTQAIGQRDDQTEPNMTRRASRRCSARQMVWELRDRFHSQRYQRHGRQQWRARQCDQARIRHPLMGTSAPVTRNQFSPCAVVRQGSSTQLKQTGRVYTTRPAVCCIYTGRSPSSLTRQRGHRRIATPVPQTREQPPGDTPHWRGCLPECRLRHRTRPVPTPP